MSCTADDVITYLISADSNGKTVVHSIGCRRPLSHPCWCPVRLAFKTVDSTIGRLRSAFRDLGREKQDNPAAARDVVKAYLRDVTNEQLMVGLVPEQATPVFSAKLRVVSLAILEALTAAVGAPRLINAPSPDKGDALGGNGLPPAGEPVGRDKIGIYHALPRRPWLAL
jgi:hypothetical protein